MKSEIKIKTYEEWLKYYENATKEDVIYDLTKDVEYFADAVKDIKQLQQELTDYKERNEKAVKLIKEFDKKEGLSMYVDTWQHLAPLLEILDKKDKE